MFLLNPFRFGSGAPPALLVDGVTFPNSDSGVRRGAGLTGAVDSKLVSFDGGTCTCIDSTQVTSF